MDASELVLLGVELSELINPIVKGKNIRFIMIFGDETKCTHMTNILDMRHVVEMCKTTARALEN